MSEDITSEKRDRRENPVRIERHVQKGNLAQKETLATRESICDLQKENFLDIVTASMVVRHPI